MAGLPPGPWKAYRDKDGDPVTAFVAAYGVKPVEAVYDDWHGAMIITSSPEVLRAIEALPLLVEAARRVVDEVDLAARLERDAPASAWMAVAGLRQALALLDGDIPIETTEDSHP